MVFNRLIFLSASVLVSMITGLLITPSFSSAAVKEVTLFPQSAKIEGTVKMNPAPSGAEDHTLTIVLPTQADPESLVISPPPSSRMRIEDIRIKPIPFVDENRIAQLRAQLLRAQTEKKELLARSNALDVQLQFWQAQIKTKTKTLSEADHLASAIGKNTRRIHSEKNTIEAELEKTAKQIKEIQSNLDQATGKSEKAYEAVITVSGVARQDSEIHYSYTLGGCGWRPLYRLEALPSANRIIFSWDAEIWQSSGEDWKAVQMHLATLPASQSITPVELPPWIIKPRPTVIYKSSRKSNAAPVTLEAAQADDVSGESIPAEKIHTTYSMWSVGKKTLMAGNRQRLKVKDETWTAQFLFLARPSRSPQAFVQAKIKLSNPVDIPFGQAIFLIDGAFIGKREFALTGAEADIFFGDSPFVTVHSVTLVDQFGGSEIFRNKQTRQWLWRIEARNTGKAAVRIRIEEPVAQLRDERIKLRFKHNPEPSEKDNVKFVWTLDLPALQTRNIESGIELEAPADMPLDFGWRK